MTDNAAGSPEGFHPIDLSWAGDFSFTVLALHGRLEAGNLVTGFRVLSSHCNVMGTGHGGLIATFCDMTLALGVSARIMRPAPVSPTITLSMDYLAPLPVGAWVEAPVEVLRIGRRNAAAQTMLRVDNKPVVRASGLFAVGPENDAPSPFDAGHWLRSLLG